MANAGKNKRFFCRIPEPLEQNHVPIHAACHVFGPVHPALRIYGQDKIFCPIEFLSAVWRLDDIPPHIGLRALAIFEMRCVARLSKYPTNALVFPLAQLFDLLHAGPWSRQPHQLP